MRDTWRHLFRRLASASLIVGSMAWSSAVCYAYQYAYDDASDPVYADGWQGRVVNAAGTAVVPTGDNGGFGFGQWDFTSLLTFGGNRYDYTTTNFHAIDNGAKSGTQFSNPHNSIGRAWALGTAPPDSNPNTKEGPPRAGRGFTLDVGQTLSIKFDNPTRRMFFKGYQINFNTTYDGVDGNICYDGVECVAGSGALRKASINRFEYFNYGEWGLDDNVEGTLTGVLDTDTSSQGAVFSMERTGATTYVATLNSLDPAKADFGPVSRAFKTNGGEINWFEITFFNPVTDTTPTLGEFQTDLYIRSMEITGPDPAGLTGDFNKDGYVDAADYVMWRKNNSVGTYEEWRTNFGEMQAGSGGGATVPEPGSFVLLVATFAGLAFAGRRNPRLCRADSNSV